MQSPFELPNVGLDIVSKVQKNMVKSNILKAQDHKVCKCKLFIRH